MWAATDGLIHPATESPLPPGSPSARYGLNLFETLRTWGGRMPFWDRHRDRLCRSSRQLGFRVPDGVNDAPGIVAELLRRNALSEGRVRVTAHLADDRWAPDSVRIEVRVEPLPPPAESWRLTWAAHPRNERSPIVGMKCGNYGELYLAWSAAVKSGCDEALFVNTRGEVTEGSRSNVFLVRSNQVRTPALECGLLPGITRSIVLELAGDLGLGVEEAVLRPADLSEADAVFMTNSVQGIIPATTLASTPLGRESNGGTIVRLRDAYHRRCAEHGG